MYLIKSWKANDVFEMLLKHEPVPFDDACQIAHDTGNLDLRARERIRQYKLVLPVWERLNKGLKVELPFLYRISIELKLFESSRSLEGASKAADLAKTVLEESKKETSKKSPGSTKNEKTSEESSSKVFNKVRI